MWRWRQVRPYEASPGEGEAPRARPEQVVSQTQGKQVEVSRIDAPSVLSVSFRLIWASPWNAGQATHAGSPRAHLGPHWTGTGRRGVEGSESQWGSGHTLTQMSSTGPKWRVIYLLSLHKPSGGCAEAWETDWAVEACHSQKSHFSRPRLPCGKLREELVISGRKKSSPLISSQKLHKPMANGLNSFLPPDLYQSHCSPWWCSIYHQNEHCASWYFTLQSLIEKWMLMKRPSMFP